MDFRSMRLGVRCFGREEMKHIFQSIIQRPTQTLSDSITLMQSQSACDDTFVIITIPTNPSFTIHARSETRFQCVGLLGRSVKSHMMKMVHQLNHCHVFFSETADSY